MTGDQCHFHLLYTSISVTITYTRRPLRHLFGTRVGGQLILVLRMSIIACEIKQRNYRLANEGCGILTNKYIFNFHTEVKKLPKCL